MRYSYEFGKTLTEYSILETTEEHFLFLYGLRQAILQTKDEAAIDALRMLEDDTKVSLSRLQRGYEPLPFRNEDSAKVDEVVLAIAENKRMTPTETGQHWQAVAQYVIAHATSEIAPQTIVVPHQRTHQ